MQKIKALMKYLKRYRKRYLVGLFFLISIDIVQLIPPRLLGFLTDGLSKHTATSSFILKYVIYLLIIAFIIAVGRYMWRIYIIGSSRYVEYDMRNTLFRHFQSMSTNFYNQNKTGDLMALATNDLNAVKQALGQGVIMLTDSIVLTLLTLCIMLSINVKLTLLSLIPLPFVALVASRFGKIIHSKFMKVQEAFSKLTDVVQENFSGIRVIKSFVQEQREYEKFTKENMYNFDTNMSLIKVWGMFSPLVEFLSSLSFVILIGLGGLYTVYGYISLGDFISFNMYLSMLVWPMMAVGWVINIIQRGFVSLERIENILNQKPDVFDNNVSKVASINGDIQINDLTFTYPGSEKPALQNINLYIKKGQTLGIIGRTGSGKSTFVNLLVRLFNVPDSKILINNNDINRIPLETLRENVGFVPQDSFLFSTTLSENVNLAFDNLDIEKVIESSKAANIHDDIMDFQDKYDTVIGERGVTLSGGQKQRISISRALIKNPDILVFDDCLSAVDAKTEVKILESLKQKMKDKTSIIISHRISAVKDSDIIAVFDNGRISETGTHKELLETKGLYYSIYEKQLIEEKIQEEEA